MVSEKVCKIKSVPLMYRQTKFLKASIAESAFLCPTDVHFIIKASFLNVNIDGLSFPPQIQCT